MDLGGLRTVANPLLEFNLGRVESSDDHQVATKNLVRLCVSDVDLQRFRQALNRLANFLLRELAVAQGVPTPGGFRTPCDVIGEKRLDFLKLISPDVVFELSNLCGVVPFDRCIQLFQSLTGKDVARVQLQGLAKRTRRTLDVPLLCQGEPKIVLRFGRLRLQVDSLAELGDGLLQLTFIESSLAFGEVEIGILIPIIGGGEFPAFLHFGGGLVFTSSPSEGQAQLIVGFATLRIQTGGFLEFLDGFRDFAVAYESFSQSEMGPREGWSDRNYLAQLFDLFCLVTWAGTVGYRQVELSFHRFWRQGDGLFEFADGLFNVRRCEGCAQIGVGVCVVGLNADGVAECGDGRFVVPSLYQYEAKAVVGLGIVGTQANCFTKFGRDRVAVGTLAPKHKAQHNVCVRPLRSFRQRLAEAGNRSIPVRYWRRRGRNVQPCL